MELRVQLRIVFQPSLSEILIKPVSYNIKLEKSSLVLKMEKK